MKRTFVAVGAGGAVLAAAALPALAISSSPDAVPGFNGTVLAVAYSGSTIYVGGDFTAAIVKGKPVARSRLAAIDAGTGALLPWAPAADGRVTSLAISGTSVYVAGAFGRIGEVKLDSLAQIDGATGQASSTFKHSISGKPYALAVDGGRLYLGGGFTSVDGSTRTRLAAFNLVSGQLDKTWKPKADGQVEVITPYGGRVYVGGRFHKVNSTGGYNRLVALHPSTGKIITSFKPKSPVIAYGIVANAGGVYSASGGVGGKVNAYSTSGKLRWTATFDGDAHALVVLGSTVYVGGHFDRVCRTARTGEHGACLDGSDARVKVAAMAVSTGKLKSWSPEANGIEGVLTMAGSSGLGAFAIGGAFTTINGKSQKRLAQFS